MTDRLERFDVDGAVRVSLRLPVGEARFVTGDPGVVEVRLAGRDSIVGRFVVEARGNDLTIEPEAGASIGRWLAVDVEVRAGEFEDLRVRLASGDLHIAVPVVSLTADAGAGDVTADEVTGPVKVKTASGDIRIERVGERLDVAAASGDITVGTVGGDVSAKTAAGDIAIHAVDGDVSVHSASGDVDIARFAGDSFNAKTMSGDVRLGVVSGRRFSVSFQSLSGDIRTDFPVSGSSGDDPAARLSATTISGDVMVRPAG